jgi:hypothetical protein
MFSALTCCDLSAKLLHLGTSAKWVLQDASHSCSGEEQFASSCPAVVGCRGWVVVVASLWLSKVAEI